MNGQLAARSALSCRIKYATVVDNACDVGCARASVSQAARKQMPCSITLASTQVNSEGANVSMSDGSDLAAVAQTGSIDPEADKEGTAARIVSAEEASALDCHRSADGQSCTSNRLLVGVLSTKQHLQGGTPASSTRYQFQEASRARSAVLAQLDDGALTLALPFERTYIEAWERRTPADGLSLEALLEVTQVHKPHCAMLIGSLCILADAWLCVQFRLC